MLLGVLALCRGSYYLYRRRRLASSGISEIDSMDGRAFELFLATLFRRLGYRVEVTRARGDYGADLVVERDGRKLAVQAKRWQKDIGVKAIQEAVGSIAMYRCDGAMVVTNREFTRPARRLADANAVELWDRQALTTKLLAMKGTPRPDDAESDATARCSACGAPVSEKVREYCLRRPARFGGKTYCFNHQRSVSPAFAD